MRNRARRITIVSASFLPPFSFMQNYKTNAFRGLKREMCNIRHGGRVIRGCSLSRVYMYRQVAVAGSPVFPSKRLIAAVADQTADRPGQGRCM